jgi:chemotaxis protein CheD
MSHFRYPAAGGAREATAQFGNVAITVLVRLFLDEGSERRDLEAQLFGGAVPPRGEPGPEETGRQNVDVGRMVLTRHGIPIVSEDVGGVKGRKLIYDTQTNEVVVLRVDQLRAGDWYPYKDDR